MQTESIFDELNEECGVFGVFGHSEAAQLTYYGLHALQHRGQESAGIVTTDGKGFSILRNKGLVTEVFNQDNLQSLVGNTAIGHVRYAKTKERHMRNVHPLVFNFAHGEMAIAINGNLVNGKRLRKKLESDGSIFQTATDTEVIAHLIARSQAPTMEEKIKEILKQLVGAFALLLLTNEKLFIAKDPHGLRPLSLARLGDAFLFASETCAFDVLGAEYIREVEPGELLILDRHGMKASRFAGRKERAVCSFEYIYFARPDSDMNEINIHSARKRMGRQLYREAPVEGDVVTGVPDSSTSAAIGYAEASGIPYELGLIKNRYVGRTFIQPSQSLRKQGVKMKLSAVRKVVEGKRVVMIDDSIVRGTTCQRIITMLRQAGATEVHVRISSPPVKYPCFYGIDTKSEQLVAAQQTVEEIKEMIGADSLAYLSIDGLLKSINNGRDTKPDCGQCLACFTGKYPTKIEEDRLVIGGKDE